MKNLIAGIEIKELKKRSDERGLLCELQRKDWEIFEEYAMTYFSISYPGVVRAWHRHPKKKQNDFMCVIQGMAKVVVYDQRKDSVTKGLINEFIIGEDNPLLLKIPGECWHGFKAIGIKPVVLINFPTKLYNYENPDEERLPPDTKKIPYNWKLLPWIKHG
jgi:dTDP-4-dehydrorhamnose 3,5-epimerase